ncbi:phosphotransferase family protein [Paracoccus alkenifer]|uniref:Predicted kinase, aminoglycoside phosphotransferase (APT) family n=1 Tax=Paracoccus alkenifer TaxID=65735 RepID=A0A1H6NAK9_9RHOB|nr:phosphotransferase family protein [Paracoccus alkenifer]SEI11974.1 Predicted kinase, aminoglycoside phosphotransferase (APT) family [Paracoccus alkenifer]
MEWSWTEPERERMLAWLKTRKLVPHDSQPVVKIIGDGHSNITSLVELGDSRLILRHQPVIRKNAPDVLREARHITKLNTAGALAPQVLAMAEAGEALDVPLYVMQHVSGIVVSGDLPEPLRQDPNGMAHAMIDALADLHGLDAALVTSRPLNDPQANRSHFAMIRGLIDGLDGQEGQALRAMADRLDDRVPDAARQCIVHSDFRLGNLMWTPDLPPRLATVLDWELSTTGDPRLDLGYFMIAYPAPGITRTPLQDLGRALYQADFPPIAELLDRYTARTGRVLADLEWFAAFVAWKTAVFYVLSRQRGEDRYYDTDAHCRGFLGASADHLARRNN